MSTSRRSALSVNDRQCAGKTVARDTESSMAAGVFEQLFGGKWLLLREGGVKDREAVGLVTRRASFHEELLEFFPGRGSGQQGRGLSGRAGRSVNLFVGGHRRGAPQ